MMSRVFSLAKTAVGRLRHVPRSLLVASVVVAALDLCCLLAFAAQIDLVVQRNRAFDVGEITIAAGDSIEFSDQDEFLHQIYIRSPTLNFDSAEQSPGEIITVKFPTAGTFEVRCHIHPKMALKVDVQ